MSQIIKFRCTPAHHFSDPITAVPVERETESSVWIKGRRQPKSSTFYCYFDTWQQAHEALIDAREKGVAMARRDLELANSYLGNVRGMKKPEGL
jgi:hypothetical protein